MTITPTDWHGYPAWAPVHPDLVVLVPEEGKKQISVEQVRDLTVFLGFTSHQGVGKAAIMSSG